MTAHIVRSKVDEFFGTEGMNVSGGVERKYHCPKCLERKGRPDRDGHLYVHLCGGACHKCRASYSRHGSFLCHRCGYSGRIAPNAFGEVGEFRPRIQTLQEEAQSSPVRPALTLPSSCPSKAVTTDLVITREPEVFPIREGMEAYHYLRSRGITHDDIDRYSISAGDGVLSKRIVVFDLDDDGDRLYWVARDYSGKSRIRYRAPSFQDASRRVQVFNIERIETTSPFIVEGVFDAIRTGPDAIALYGCIPTEEQIRRIAAKGIRKPFCALDPGAWDRNVALADRLYRMGLEPWLIRIPDGPDPGDLGREAMLELQRHAFPYNPKKKLSLLFNSAA